MPAPKVQPLVANCLDQSNELPLICSELGMPRCQLAAEESHWSTTLMEQSAQARVGRVAFHDDVTVEVRKL
jgi:hypothetical protein